MGNSNINNEVFCSPFMETMLTVKTTKSIPLTLCIQEQQERNGNLSLMRLVSIPAKNINDRAENSSMKGLGIVLCSLLPLSSHAHPLASDNEVRGVTQTRGVKIVRKTSFNISIIVLSHQDTTPVCFIHLSPKILLFSNRDLVSKK